MKNSKYLNIIISTAMVFCLCALCGCQKLSFHTDADSQETNATTQKEAQSELLTGVSTGDRITTQPTACERKTFTKFIEAEKGTVTGNITKEKSITGFTGEGYMKWPDDSGDNSLKVSVTLPSAQHYNITIGVYSEAVKRNEIFINGEKAGDFVTTGNKKFENITLRNVFAVAGDKSIEIKQIDGGICADFIYVQDSSDIDEYEYKGEGKLCNTASDSKTTALMKYISDNYGKQILSGQFVTPGTNNELDVIYKNTGYYPAIRLSDMSCYTDKESSTKKSDVNLAKDWSDKGGIVGYVWHWQAPDGGADYYTKNTEFKLSKAVTTEKIYNLPLEKIKEYALEGKISQECYELVADIDKVSAQLKYLKDSGVPVLWRPLPEASGGWFWWGSDGKDAYIWLYNLIYQRQTEFFGLNNLIWIWNAQKADWYVGDDKCDIISADIYDENNLATNYANTYISLAKICDTKPVALSEAYYYPLMDTMLRDKTMWSWAGLWSGDYIMTNDKELSSQRFTKDDLMAAYNNDKIISLEALAERK